MEMVCRDSVTALHPCTTNLLAAMGCRWVANM